jgi:hypothetical protein
MSTSRPLNLGSGFHLPFLLGAALDPEQAPIPSEGDTAEALIRAGDDVSSDGRPPGPVRRHRRLLAAGRCRGGRRGGGG